MSDFRASVVADLHIGDYRSGPVINGVNGRLLDIRDRLSEIAKYTITNGIPHMIILGDIFKEKRPSPMHLSVFTEFLSTLLERGTTVIVFPGNHDMHKIQGEVHAMKPLKYLQGHQLMIIDEPTSLVLSKINVLVFPYIKSPQRNYLPDLLKQANKNSILLMHGTIEGAALHGMGDFEIFDEDYIPASMISDLQAVFAGHIHEFQHFGNVWYPGSIERLTFDDEGHDKFFLDVEINRGGDVNVTSVRINARPMMTIAANKLSSVEQGIIDIRQAVVRVIGVERQNVQEIRQLLMKKGCYFVASIQTATRTISPVQNSHAITNFNMSEFVRTFAQKNGYKGDLQEAEKMVKQFVDAAPEAYE